jgi:hypothetical protein
MEGLGGVVSADWKSLRSYAAVHALGALDGEELELVRAELETLSAGEKDEYRAWVRTSQLLLLSAAQTVPPPELKQRIFDRVQAEKPRPSGLQARRRPATPLERAAASLGVSTTRLLQLCCLGLLAVAGVLGAAALLGYGARVQAGRMEAALQDGLARTRDSLAVLRHNVSLLGAPRLQVVFLHQAGMKDAWGAVFWDPAEGAALLQTRGLPPGRHYALWVMTDGQAFPALHFRELAGDGAPRRIGKLPESDRRRITAFVITEEKDSTARRPSDALWLQGAPLL